jgi:DNA-binding MltR family transcriptional regulator
MERVIPWSEFVNDMSTYLADTLHQNAIKEAIDKINAISFDVQDLGDIFTRLQRESDTAVILIFFSYLEEKFFQLLLRHFHNIDNNTSRNDLFGANGPLNSFHNRVRISYHLGWITERTKTKVEALRKVRNKFSHRAFAVSFEDPFVRSHFDTICDDLDERTQAVLKISEDWLQSIGYKIHWERQIEERTRWLLGLAMLAHDIFFEMLAIPVSKEIKVGSTELSKSEVVSLTQKTAIATYLNVLIALGHITKVDTPQRSTW